MYQQDETAPAPRSLLLQLTDVACVILPGNDTYEEKLDQSHAVYVFAAGAGSLYVDDKLGEAAAEWCYLVPPGTGMRLETDDNEAVTFYRIAFAAYSPGEGLPERYDRSLAEAGSALKVFPYSKLYRYAEQLHADKAAEGGIAWLKQNLLFQELMVFLLEQNAEDKSETTVRKAVEKSLEYMRINYMYPVTVKQLADEAQVPYWQYSSVFKELTGKKPLDYMTELRINVSKEKLARSDARLRDIALEVGFSDEYYFNRIFSRTTGTTPRQYALASRRGVAVKDWTGHEVHIPETPNRVIYYGEALGDLLTLGIRPVGSIVRNPGSPLYGESTRHIQNIGHPIRPEKVSALKPDLIILTNSDERQYERISRIAPTVTYNSWGTLEERMTTLGAWFGKQTEASAWLRRFRTRADTMWSSLSGQVNTGETASVFVYHRGKRLFVMGNRGLSDFLYHPAGFKPPERIGQMLAEGMPYKEIRAEEIAEYAGDRLFMVMPENQLSRQAADELLQSPLWRGLSAYRSGYHYEVEENSWNAGDAFSQERLLALLPDLLARAAARP